MVLIAFGEISVYLCNYALKKFKVIHTMIKKKLCLLNLISLNECICCNACKKYAQEILKENLFIHNLN